MFNWFNVHDTETSIRNTGAAEGVLLVHVQYSIALANCKCTAAEAEYQSIYTAKEVNHSKYTALHILLCKNVEKKMYFFFFK